MIPFSGHVAHITSWHNHGSLGLFASGGTPATAIWPTANKVFYFPFRLTSPVVIVKAFWVNGTTVGDTLDIGIFTSDGAKLISSGNVSQGSVSTVTSFDLTDTCLGAGLYYGGLGLVAATGHIFRQDIGNLVHQRCLGWAEMVNGLSANVFVNPAVYATITARYAPMFGFTARTTI